MKDFLNKTGIFICPFILFYLLTTFYYSDNHGDLTRIGFITSDDSYRDKFKKEFNNKIYFESLAAVDTSKPLIYTVLTIGDSFSEQKSFGYKNYLAKSDSITLLHFNRLDVNSNPIESLYSLINGDLFDKIKVKYIILQSVERSLTDRGNHINKHKKIFLKNILNNQNITKPSNETKFIKKIIPSTAFAKYPFYTILYGLDDNAFISDVYRLELTKPMFTGNRESELLVYHNEIATTNKNNNTDKIIKLNDELNSLSHILLQKGIKLIVLPSPNKYTIYYNLIRKIEEHPQPMLFEKLEKLEKHYIYINSFKILKNAVSSGTKDIYFSDDTHWSPVGSKMIAEELKGVILNN